MELKLHTSYDSRFIRQAWEEHGSDIMGGRRATIMQRIVDTEEAGIRQALINMGWTPPCHDQPTTGVDSKESALGTEKEEHF